MNNSMNKLLYILPIIGAMILIPMVNAVPANCDFKNPISMAYLLCKDQIYDSKISNMDAKMSAYDKKIAHLESIVMPGSVVTAEGQFTSVSYDSTTQKVIVEGEVIKHSSFSTIVIMIYDQHNFNTHTYLVDNQHYLGVIDFKQIVSNIGSNITSFKINLVDINGSNKIILDSTIVSLLP